MKIDVTPIMAEATGFSRTYALKDEPLEVVELSLAQPVNGSVTLLRWDEGIQLSGQVEGALRVVCHRCLTEFEQAVRAPLQVNFSESPRDEEFPIATNRRGSELELDPLIAQELVLQLPAQVLCREDCLGLCVECGQVQETRHQHA